MFMPSYEVGKILQQPVFVQLIKHNRGGRRYIPVSFSTTKSKGGRILSFLRYLWFFMQIAHTPNKYFPNGNALPPTGYVKRYLLPYVQGYFQLQPQVYFKKCAVYSKILIIFATY